MTITLEAIEAEQTRIGAMIAAFKAQPHATEYRVDGVTIPLAAGERVAGPVLNDDGTLSHYLIKLPGASEEMVNHQGARAYAHGRCAVTPTRREGRLLQANLPDELPEEAIWLDDEYDGDSSFAWCQDFYGGIQFSGGRKSAALRAVAVRRFIPSVI
ncbi:DUF1566 domain-containing protein [Paraburkholderia bryophila]|uniref:DUF1566 domain-containing protein n=1 Tax=Paraburkholderia bryophila TaxID=420952 RepID=A0A7Y9WJM8_9BURK|nr:DUF1566 domain-containing protein [Paraburkholderia bryophila]NYH21421.1 hypothetical protein [Paraburkholderia bryophila]